MLEPLQDLKIKIFADGANLTTIADLIKHPIIKGFTTNPTLLRRAGITDYEGFAKVAIQLVGNRPISLEVLSDTFNEMAKQARIISSWGKNVYVKIPITNSNGDSSELLIKDLSRTMKINVTAVMTSNQAAIAMAALSPEIPSFISVFAGRIADTGVDPVDLIRACVKYARNTQVIWASPREIFNVYQAESVGCHIITLTHDLLYQSRHLGKDLKQYSLETVQQFTEDAKVAEYTVPENPFIHLRPYKL